MISKKRGGGEGVSGTLVIDHFLCVYSVAVSV